MPWDIYTHKKSGQLSVVSKEDTHTVEGFLDLCPWSSCRKSFIVDKKDFFSLNRRVGQLQIDLGFLEDFSELFEEEEE